MLINCQMWIYVLTNSHSSQGECQLYIFEDNEAVIKMIIKGRGRTMRHVSRTHRVALDWLFDRINLAVPSWWCVDWHKETCFGPIWDERCQRQDNGWSDQYKETCAGFWASCWQQATIRTRSSSGKEYLKMPSYKMERRWKKSTKSWKNEESDHAQNPFVTICRKIKWSSVKNQVSLFSRWATWSGSSWDKPRRLFSVLLAWSTYQRDWTCVYAASGFDPIKARWTVSEQLLQRWQAPQ